MITGNAIHTSARHSPEAYFYIGSTTFAGSKSAKSPEPVQIFLVASGKRTTSALQ